MDEKSAAITSTEQATDFLLQSMCRAYEHLGSEIRDGRLLLPAAGLTVSLAVTEMSDTYVNSSYYISSPAFDRSLYECCAINSSDLPTALSMVQASFMFGIMETVLRMVSAEPPYERLTTEFVGKSHEWEVYLGDIVGVSVDTMAEDEHEQVFWHTLREHIAKRIGNQKLCYVKIFAANSGDGQYIEGECRINDLRSDELSRIVYDMAAGWQNKGFASRKQFFVLRQSDETRLPYPYTENEVMNKTEQVMKLFEKCGDEEYADFSNRLAEVLGDSDLAAEMYALIPEICAESAIHQLSYPETLTLSVAGQELHCYKTQMASYTGIYNGIFRTMDTGVLSDPDDVFMSYIGVSSIGNVVGQYTKQGKSLDDLSGATISLTHHMGGGYRLR